MKKNILFLCAFLATLGSIAQSCCSNSSCNEMAVFARDESFVKAHRAPLPFILAEPEGQTVSFSTPDGKMASGYLLKAKTRSIKWLFVFQEWWGLNDYIKQEAQKLYNDLGANVNVIALDMYDGKVATTPDEAKKLVSEVKEDRLMSIVKGASKLAGKSARIASIGWCFGGGLSLKSALEVGSKAIGCVMYYGAPVTDVEKLKTLNCDVMGIFGLKDKWINPEMVKTFEENMKAAGKAVTIKNFDADHAFANPSNPVHDKVATEEAYKLSLEYLKTKFK